MPAFERKRGRLARHSTPGQPVASLAPTSIQVRYFFEEGAIDDDGKVVVPKERAFNKLGHALHVEDPTFKRCTFDTRIQAIAKSLGMRRPIVPQSMYIFKQPGIGGEVRRRLWPGGACFAGGGWGRAALALQTAAVAGRRLHCRRRMWPGGACFNDSGCGRAALALQAADVAGRRLIRKHCPNTCCA